MVGYRNVHARGPLTLTVRPLLAFRDCNLLAKRNEAANAAVERATGFLSVQPYSKLPRLYFHCKPDGVELKPDWYLRFTYPIEQERGLDFEEDLFTPFEMSFKIPAGQTVYVVASTDRETGINADELVARERDRRKTFEKESDPVRQTLLIAADQFTPGGVLSNAAQFGRWYLPFLDRI